LLEEALLHRSWCAENAGHVSNERLEFLGDAVLGLIVTDHVYSTYAALSEGELTDIRKAVVNSVTLAEVATELDLGAYVVLGKGEEGSGGREKPSILADALEAVIGCVYVHAGFERARALVLRLLADRIAAAEALGPGGQDHKSRLQELVAKHFTTPPRYETEADGPDHARTFRVTVVIDQVARGTGEGRSKKQAEQSAAREAFVSLQAELEPHRDDPARTLATAGSENAGSADG
jgi:ribonuclease-3